MRITEQEHETRKTRMIRVAYALFCQSGIDCISIAQIAKAAGVSANSIFRYFDSKAALVQCTQLILWEEVVAHILLGSEEQLSLSKNGLDEITILLSNFRRLYQEHSEFLLFASDYKLFLVRNHIKITQAFHDDMMRPIFTVFTAALTRGQADGSIAKLHSVADLFSAMWGVMRGFVSEIVLYDYIYDGENPWKNQFDLVLHYSLVALTAKPVQGGFHAKRPVVSHLTHALREVP